MCEALKNSQYEICEELGRGRFGVVNRCFDSATGTSYACKTVHKPSLVDPTDLRSLEIEPKILRLLSLLPSSSSSNTLCLHDVFEDEECLVLITDLCTGGDLYDLLSTRQRLSEPEAASIAAQLVSAVAHCHRLGVAHRDLKPDNVLFDSYGRLKLADFGSAEVFGANQMSGIVGTPYYVAPEVLMGREYDEKIDVWSCGVILYVMLSGTTPFHGKNAKEIFEAVLRGNLRFPTKIFRTVSPEAKDLLRKMICRDVSRRLSAEQVLSE